MKTLLERANICGVAFACAVLMIDSGTTASAFTGGDANTLLNQYNSAFYQVFASGKGRYKSHKSGGDTGFWQQAEEIEVLESAYQRTNNGTYRNMISELLNGFSSDRGTNWSGNSFNDDIMWACLAYLRGYQLTGNTTFRSIAKSNFDMCYARAWDAAAGGLWWTTARTSKNSAVNGPGSMAAYKLYETLGDASYRSKAIAINDWQRANCFNESNGQVYDSPSDHVPTTYNQGTFINACFNRGSTGGATKACDYLMTMGSTSPTSNGYRLMPQYGIDNNNSGFNGIGIRWATKFMKDMGYQSRYLGWLQANAQAAWDVRRLSDGLSWCQWHQVLQNGTYVGSWDCSSSVSALQVVPPNQ